MPKGLDGFFIKYGITEEDLGIIEQACNAKGIDPAWLQEEILAKLQERKNDENSRTVGDMTIRNIVAKAIENY